VSIALDGKPLIPAPEPAALVRIEKATYGVPGDPKRTRDVRAKLQTLLDAGEFDIGVTRMAAGDDPAYGVVKTLDVAYTIGGTSHNVVARDPDTISFPVTLGAEAGAYVREGGRGGWAVETDRAGRYELKTAKGRSMSVEVEALPEPLEIGGPWELAFPPNWGAPEKLTLGSLVSWSDHPDPGVKHFSGTATYAKTVSVPGEMLAKWRKVHLDLGKVMVMAAVKLNGKDLGILWKPPYRLDVTDVLKPGDNTLEIGVTNLWINRMLGDEELPEDSERNPDGTLKAWPQWVQEGKPSPAGRFTFTSWRLWKKGEPLAESGLVGPVTLRVSALAKVR